MKKQLSHFAYNERSRSGWTLSIPPFTSLSPLRSTIKNCYLCPRHVCYPCLRSAQERREGVQTMKVVVHGLTKEFTTGQGKIRALGGVDIEVRDREFFGIVGPTGCGKTTLLHIMASLEKSTQGGVEFVGEKRTKSLVSMVFQDSALMPWRTVEENVPLGAEFRKEERSTYKRISQFFLEMVRLLDFSGARPAELSGGMKQKVAIARALAN